MDVLVFPIVMTKGIKSQRTISAAAVKRIWEDTVDGGAPAAGTRGFVLRIADGAPNPVILGGEAVTVAGAEKGFPLTAGQVATGAIVDDRAREIYRVSAGADYTILELE